MQYHSNSRYFYMYNTILKLQQLNRTKNVMQFFFSHFFFVVLQERQISHLIKQTEKVNTIFMMLMLYDTYNCKMEQIMFCYWNCGYMTYKKSGHSSQYISLSYWSLYDADFSFSEGAFDFNYIVLLLHPINLLRIRNAEHGMVLKFLHVLWL